MVNNSLTYSISLGTFMKKLEEAQESVAACGIFRF